MGFWDFFKEGILHILDPNGIDHMLFLLAMAVVFIPSQWKSIFILATGFTIGHSITLIAITFEWFHIPSKWVEFGIPCTILLTVLANLAGMRRRKGMMNVSVYFLLVTLFGLIHGMGFSPYLKMLIPKGESLNVPLLAFNLGVEAGQIMFLMGFLVIQIIVHSLTRIKHREWVIFALGCVFSLTLLFISERLPW